MKTLFKFIVALLALTFPAIALATDVNINLANAQLGVQQYTNRNLLIQPMSLPSASSPSVLLPFTLRAVTGTNGSYLFTNAFPGLYKITVQAPPDLQMFQILVTDTNLGVVNASDILAASYLSTFPAGTVAWAAAVTDGRYSRGSNAPITFNMITNGLGYLPATNGVLPGITGGTNTFAITNAGVVSIGVTNLNGTNITAGTVPDLALSMRYVSNYSVVPVWLTNGLNAVVLTLTNPASGQYAQLSPTGAYLTNASIFGRDASGNQIQYYGKGEYWDTNSFSSIIPIWRLLGGVAPYIVQNGQLNLAMYPGQSAGAGASELLIDGGNSGFATPYVTIRSNGIPFASITSDGIWHGNGAGITNVPIAGLPNNVLTNNYVPVATLNTNLNVGGTNAVFALVSSNFVQTISGVLIGSSSGSTLGRITMAKAAANDGGVALGSNSLAGDVGAFAQGANSRATTVNSVAMGDTSTASGGDASFAMGNNAMANGVSAWALGDWANVGDLDHTFVLSMTTNASARSGIAGGVNIFADTGIYVATNFTLLSGRMTGNGLNITNIIGTNIVANTINSNQFDPPTRAMLGGGSIPGNVVTNGQQNVSLAGSFTGQINVTSNSDPLLPLADILANNFVGGFIGDGSLITNIAGTNIVGFVKPTAMGTNVFIVAGTNINIVTNFSIGQNTYTISGVLWASNLIGTVFPSQMGTNVILVPGSNVTISTNFSFGVMTYTINSSATGPGSGWSLTGNSGLVIPNNFLGTLDTASLIFKVNSVQYGVMDRYGSVAFGSAHSIASPPGPTGPNTISGGTLNTISGSFSTGGHTISGGVGNAITGTSDSCAISGGVSNTISGGFSTVIAGGLNNFNAGYEAIIAGGSFNKINAGQYNVIVGGRSNLVNADYTFAAGSLAYATNAGSFVWADPQNSVFGSAATNTFNIRAQNGIVSPNTALMTNGFASFSRNKSSLLSSNIVVSPYLWTNTLTSGGLPVNCYVFLFGGTLSGVGINGTQIGNAAGNYTIPLQPGEWIGVTNSVAPTLVFKPY